jgi:hypothetical protein
MPLRLASPTYPMRSRGAVQILGFTVQVGLMRATMLHSRDLAAGTHGSKWHIASLPECRIGLGERSSDG